MSGTRKSELWIGGEHVAPSSGRYFEDLNPDDDSVYSSVAQASAGDMDRAVRVAQAAFLANQHWLAADRERWLSKAAELVERDRQEFVDIREIEFRREDRQDDPLGLYGVADFAQRASSAGNAEAYAQWFSPSTRVYREGRAP